MEHLFLVVRLTLKLIEDIVSKITDDKNIEIFEEFGSFQVYCTWSSELVNSSCRLLASKTNGLESGQSSTCILLLLIQSRLVAESLDTDGRGNNVAAVVNGFYHNFASFVSFNSRHTRSKVIIVIFSLHFEGKFLLLVLLK